MTPAQTLAKAQATARREALELALLQQLRALKLDSGLVREHLFHNTRKWRFDFAFPALLLAIEADGGIHSAGRHLRGTGFEEDCRKINEAIILGWRVLRVTPNHIHSGQALQWIQRALEIP